MAQVSSADDFLHFYQALLGGRLIKPETLAEMARPRSTVTGGSRYGLGFGLASYGLVHYGGGTASGPDGHRHPPQSAPGRPDQLRHAGPRSIERASSAGAL